MIDMRENRILNNKSESNHPNEGMSDASTPGDGRSRGKREREESADVIVLLEDHQETIFLIIVVSVIQERSRFSFS